jgi:hypothetical protein
VQSNSGRSTYLRLGLPMRGAFILLSASLLSSLAPPLSAATVSWSPLCTSTTTARYSLAPCVHMHINHKSAVLVHTACLCSVFSTHERHSAAIVEQRSCVTSAYIATMITISQHVQWSTTQKLQHYLVQQCIY